MERLRTLLINGVADGVFPGAVLTVSRKGKPVFSCTVGCRNTIPSPSPLSCDTIFDLASLTKPLATTSAIMSLVDHAGLHPDDRLSALLPSIFPELKASIRIRDILSHCSGMPAWHPFYLTLQTLPPSQRRTALRGMLKDMPLESIPSKKTNYSDLGFMMLEWVIEGLVSMDLGDYISKTLFMPLGLKRTFLSRADHGFPNDTFAATENCPWRGKVLEGETHDENAWVLGGFSGHAGLFGTAEEVDRLLNLLLANYNGERRDFFNPDTVREFFRRAGAPDENTWALGWDTPSSSGSSSGRYFSKKSVGHLGFTGTSVWIDLEREICVTLLTNRVHPTRENIKIRTFRPVLHDLVMEELC